MLSAIAILFPSHHFVCNTMLFYSSSSSSPSSSSSSSSSFWLCMVCRRLSSHWQLPRLRNYLHELSRTFDDLCSSFFGRLLPLLYKGFLDHVAGSVIASCLTYYKNWQEKILLTIHVGRSSRYHWTVDVKATYAYHLQAICACVLQCRASWREFSLKARLTRRENFSSQC